MLGELQVFKDSSALAGETVAFGAQSQTQILALRLAACFLCLLLYCHFALLALSGTIRV
jgi:hypothetical protein